MHVQAWGKMKVAIILEEPLSPAPWALRLLDTIRASPQFEISALLQPVGGERKPRCNPLIRAWLWVESMFAARPKSVDCEAFAKVHSNLRILKLDQLALIEGLGLDVILDLTDGLVVNCPAQLARHGVWFLDFLSVQVGMASLQSVIGKEPVTWIGLMRRVAGRSEPLSIAHGALNTKFIAARNALFMCEKAVALIMRELNRTCAIGRPQELATPYVTPLAVPGFFDFAAYLASLIAESFARTMDLIFARLRVRPGMFFLKSSTGDFLGFDPAGAQAHIPGPNQFHADPFLWVHGGACYCFFETFDYAANKGHISVGRFEAGALVDIREALSATYHLSFPCLFEDNGTLYMIPETYGARRVEIWRCVAFPDTWERHAIGLEGVTAADSTLARIDGNWWLFTNISTDPFDDMNTELHLFRADGPDLRSLVPHPLNPVVFDSRTARNAGRILERNGIYYRPSQDNSHGVYGHGLNIMRIDQLAPDEYAETMVRRIEPVFERGINGCHHLDSRSGQIVMDVRKRLGGL